MTEKDGENRIGADIRALASARVEVDALKAELEEAEQALAISPLVVKCAQLEKRIFDMVVIRDDLDDAIRGAALREYRSVGITCPHPAVSVKTFTEHRFPTRPHVHINSDLSAYINTQEEGA